MLYKEKKRNLFTLSDEYYLAHCISADFALGKGIAKTFNDIYGIRAKLRQQSPELFSNERSTVGKAILVDNVFNLVTKEKYYQKPTYDTLTQTLNDMRRQCKQFNIKKLAMPKIGCGLDKLQWEKVKQIIIDTFQNDDINIIICYL